MKRSILFLLLAGLACCPRANAQGSSAPATYSEKVRRYIATYKDLAMAEQKRSGIPAAVTLAQGILESGAGESELATEAANHFGIKCKKGWMGETFNHDDDAPEECFRKYSSAEASYRDHTDYLKTAGRYQPCFAQSTTDYAAWAYQLKTCGYATSPTYAQRLIRIVEEYKLQQYTYAALDSQDPLRTAQAGEVVPEDDAPPPTTATPVLVGEKPQPQPQAAPPEGSRLSAHSETPAEARTREMQAQQARAAADAKSGAPSAPVLAADGTAMKDGRRGFYAKRGDVLLENAIRYRIRYAKLLEINGLPDEPLSADRFIFLEKASASRLAHDVAALAAHDETAGVASSAPQKKVVPAPATGELVASASPITVAAKTPEDGPDQTGSNMPDNRAAEDERVESSDVPSESSSSVAIEIDPVPGRVPEPIDFREEPMRQAEEPVDEPKIEVAAPAPSLEIRKQVELEEPTDTQGVVSDAAAPASEGEVTSNIPSVNDDPIAQPTRTVAENDSYSTTNPGITRSPEGGFNIAGENAVEESASDEDDRQDAAPPVVAEPEPKDPMSRLKARFDKAVYAPATPRTEQRQPASAPQTATPVKAVPNAASNTSAAKTYTVQKGDTAFGIAKKHGITVRQLQEWNGLSMDGGVPLGKKLKVQP